MRKVSIIIPVIRPEKVELCIGAIVKNSGVGLSEYEIVTDIDSGGIGCPKMVAKLVKMAKHDLIMFLGDDCEPEENFLKEALEAMETIGWGVVGLNTQPGNPLAHWMADKRMLDLIPGGEFFPLEYAHCWCDNELADIAKENERWVFAEKSKILHHHPINKTAEYDEGYQKAYSDKNQKHDRETYIMRKIERNRSKGGLLGIGFPLTYNYVHTAFFETWNMLEKPNHISLMPKFHGHMDAVRNNIVHQSLMCGCTHLLFMDTDQVYRTPDMITRMFDTMKERDIQFLSAPVHRRYEPYDPILYQGELGKYKLVDYEKAYSGDIIEIDATGTGCVMIDTRVFLSIPDPWFEETRKTEAGKPVGEDICFCDKMKRTGHSLYCDTSLTVGHLCMFEANRGLHEWYMYANKMEAQK